MTIHLNRRQHERFVLQPMYSRVTMRRLDGESFEYEGHAYDISEAGLLFEMDRGVEPGTTVVLRIDLPYTGEAEPGHIEVFSRIVRVDEEDAEFGPVRMAASFVRFTHFGDKQRLIAHFCTGRYARAA